MTNPMPCLFCPAPRSGSLLHCGAPECRAAVNALPLAELAAVREREGLAAIRKAPADGRGVYIHLTPRD